MKDNIRYLIRRERVTQFSYYELMERSWGVSKDLTQKERFELICGHLYFYIDDAKRGGNNDRIDEIEEHFNKLASIFKSVYKRLWCAPPED